MAFPTWPLRSRSTGTGRTLTAEPNRRGLDLERLAALSEPLGVGLRQLVDQLRCDIGAGIEELDAAFASEDLTAIAQTAHTARNDALMLDAKELLRTLEGLENAARDGERARVSTELQRLHAVWPGLREQLLRAAERPPP